MKTEPKKALPVDMINPKKVIINLLNSKKDPNAKTTHCIHVLTTDELDEVINSNIFFPKGEIKSVFFNNKPYNWK